MSQRRRRPPPRLLEVASSEAVSPHLHRINFTGTALSDFPDNAEGASLKLLLRHPGQSDADYLDALQGNGPRPLKRTYTVSRWCHDTQTLSVDFALHDNPGPATQWAQQATTGDTMAVTGPGRDTRVANNASWYLLAADLAALPALAANLRSLPADASGNACIEIPDAADQRELQAPASIQVQWIVDADSTNGMQALVDAVQACKLQDGGVPGVWCAGESQGVRQLREWLRSDLQIAREHRHTSGYWQHGCDEDSFQSVKQAMMVDD